MRKPIHLVCDTYTRYVVKSVLKSHREKGSVQVVEMNGKFSWNHDDTLIVWHGADTASTILFYYLCKIVPGVLYEIDYTHANQYAENGYCAVALGKKALIKGGFVGAHTVVPDHVKVGAAAQWDRLNREKGSDKPLMLMGEDGIIRPYPDDYLDDWIIGIIKDYLQEKGRISIPHVVGSSLGIMLPSNDNVLGVTFFERRLSRLVAEHRVKIKDKYILNDGGFDSFDNSWLDDCPNEWASYQRWKDSQIEQKVGIKKRNN